MPSFLAFKSIFIKVKRKKILKALDKHFLGKSEGLEFIKMKRRVEKAINKLKHLESVIERVLSKIYEHK